jgi:hypothetical protein
MSCQTGKTIKKIKIQREVESTRNEMSNLVAFNQIEQVKERIRKFKDKSILHETKALLHSKGNRDRLKDSLQNGTKSLPAIYLKGINNQNIQGAQKSNLPKNQQFTE